MPHMGILQTPNKTGCFLHLSSAGSLPCAVEFVVETLPDQIVLVERGSGKIF